MITIWRMMATVGLVLVVVGCYEHTYTVGGGAPAGRSFTVSGNTIGSGPDRRTHPRIEQRLPPLATRRYTTSRPS